MTKTSFEMLIKLGQESATAITGDPDDAKDIQTSLQAIAAIEAELKLGREAHNKFQNLRARMRNLLLDFE